MSIGGTLRTFGLREIKSTSRLPYLTKGCIAPAALMRPRAQTVGTDGLCLPTSMPLDNENAIT